MTPGFRTLPIERIWPSDYLPGDPGFSDTQVIERARYLREQSGCPPLHVGDDGSGYCLLADELTFRAARAVGLTEVPALVYAGNDLELRKLALFHHHNAAHPDLFATAELLERLTRPRKIPRRARPQRLSQAAAGELIHLSQTDVAHLLRLRRGLHSRVIQWIRDPYERLTPGHGRLLAGMNQERQVEWARMVLHGRWSVARLASELKRGTPNNEGAVTSEKDKNVLLLEEELSERVGNQVVIDYASNGQGTVTIHYHNFDEAEGIFHRLRSTPPPIEPAW